MVPTAACDVALLSWEHIPALVSWHCCKDCYLVTGLRQHCSTIAGSINKMLYQLLKDAPR